MRDAAHLITTGEATTVVVAGAGAGILGDDGATAPWTRPANELVVGYGLFTAAEFALMARRHMIDFGTTPEQMARSPPPSGTTAAPIPTPCTRAEDRSRPMTSWHRGWSPTRSTCSTAPRPPRAAAPSSSPTPIVPRDLAQRPVHILGSASDSFGTAYSQAPSWDLRGAHSGDDVPAG